MSQQQFPVQPNYWRSGLVHKPHSLSIPWSVAELAYSTYAARYGQSQSLERLAQRGGFSASEMDDFLPDWRTRCDTIAALEADNKRLRELIVDAYDVLCATPELNMSNYDHDDVAKLNTGAIEACLMLQKEAEAAAQAAKESK